MQVIYKVLLTGKGSDEVLAGYPFFRMDLMRSAKASAVAGAQANLQATNLAARGFLLPVNAVSPPPAYLERLGYFPSLLEGRKAELRQLACILTNPIDADEPLTGLLDWLDAAGQMTVKPLLTKRVYKREKHSFFSPPVLLKPDEPLYALMQDTLRGKSLERVPFRL